MMAYVTSITASAYQTHWALIIRTLFLISLQLGVFNTRAPVTCYKCDHMIHASSCNTTTQCNIGEVCAVRRYQGPSGDYQSSGCIDESKCSAVGQLIASAPHAIGKRNQLVMTSAIYMDKRQHNTMTCEKCCFGEKCNVLDCTTSSIHVCKDKVSQCSNQIYRDAICADDQNAVMFCQKSCNKCPVDGGFSSWLPWSDCSVSCGAAGESFRVRTCDNPKPLYNGLPCQGTTLELKHCNNGPCPVDGHWSNWGQWLPCNATCGNGTAMRIRSCSNPVPKFGGKPCANPASFQETKHCNIQPCPVDGHWSDWGQWLPCNATCGNGTAMRIRSCSNPVPKFGGNPCANPASFLETKYCNTQPCPVDGHWSNWGQWLPCNATCGTGTALRIRSCSNPVPKFGGKPCANPASFQETKHCNTQPCPVTTTTTTTSRDKVLSGSTSFASKSNTALTPTMTPTMTPLVTVTNMITTSTPSSTHSSACRDQRMCSDPHVQQTACNDLYLAATYCPKLCHLCGPTSTPPTCSDLAGKKCKEALFEFFTCQDPDLVDLCRLSCGKCHR